MTNTFINRIGKVFSLPATRGACGKTIKWVEVFRVAGPGGLRPRKKCRKNTLDKPAKKNSTQPVDGNTVDTGAGHVKELEDELLKLRIGNAFLKELGRLRLEDGAKTGERPRSSAVPKDSPN